MRIICKSFLRHLVEKGLDLALEHGNRGSRRARALDGESEVRIIALACSEPLRDETVGRRVYWPIRRCLGLGQVVQQILVASRA